MYRIYLGAQALHYAGCPSHGIDAVDWRLARGLKPEPTSLAGRLEHYYFSDEALCRAHRAALDADADYAPNDGPVAMRPAVADFLLALPEDWQKVDAPLNPAEREALAELLDALDARDAKGGAA